MVVFENKVLSNSGKLKLIVSKLTQLAAATSQLVRYMAVLQLPEGYIEEGTIADRRFVDKKIQEIFVLVADLDRIILVFDHGDLSAPQEKQGHLNRAIIAVDALRSDMLDVWKMRNSGDTQEDNTKIQNVVKTLFSNVNTVLSN